jgi:hypothetical protein
MFRIKSPQDAGAAVVFMVIGLAGAYLGSDLAFGTSARMGPGYFPIILSWTIFAIGVIVGLRGLTIEGPAIEPVQLRPLLVIIAAIVAAGYARRDVSLWETLLLAAGLAVFSVALFVYGLSQPFPAWWGR